jgi:hypothetical protein
MTFAIVYIEHGDLVADFEDREEAYAALEEFVKAHPEVAHRVGLLAFDDEGMPAGEYESAAELFDVPAEAAH